jgi:hypothetical protein
VTNKFSRTHYLFLGAVLQVEFTLGLISANNQCFYVKNTQQKSSATFLPFFEKSAKHSAGVSIRLRRFIMGPLLCFTVEI